MLAGERTCLLRDIVVSGCLLRIVLRRPPWNSLLNSASQKDCVVFRPSEVSQTKTDIMWCHLYAELKKKMIQMNFFTKQKKSHRHRKETYGYQRGKGKGGTRRLDLTHTCYYV